MLPPGMTQKQEAAIMALVDGNQPAEIAAAGIAAIVGEGNARTHIDFVVVARTGTCDVDPSTEYPLPEPVTRADGQQIFEAKTKAQQDEMVGPEAAELIRNGDITIHDLYSHSRLENRPDYLTQKPLKDISKLP